MTHEELIARAREFIERLEIPDECPTLDELPKCRVVEAVVVYFESDEHDGRIEVFLDRDSGQLITATLAPRQRRAPR